MRKRIIVLLTAVLIGLGVGIVTATSAQAAPIVQEPAPIVAQRSLSQCNQLAAQMCRWVDANYSGAFGTFTPGTANACYNVPAAWDDVISSAANYRPLDQLRLYSKYNCAGGWGSAELRIGPNVAVPNLGAYAIGNDSVSSFRWVPLL